MVTMKQKMDELVELATEEAVEMHRLHGGPYIDHFYEAAWAEANAYAREHGADTDSVLAAIMRTAGYDANHPSGQEIHDTGDYGEFGPI